MKYAIEKEGVFIPSFNGNKNLSEKDQITVTYRYPTMAALKRCRKKPQAKGIANANGGIERLEIAIEKDDDAVIRELLVSIKNCSCVCEGKESHIVTAGDLFDAPVQLAPLYKEIAAEFDRILDQADISEKN